MRDISEYERVLWLDRVPHRKSCFTRAWGYDQEYEPDIWLEVRGEREPSMPGPPIECIDWIETDKLGDKGHTPSLLSQIPRQYQNPDWQEGSDQPQWITRWESLDDTHGIRERWDAYIEEFWRPWVALHNQWESVQVVYSSLFAMYQDQLRLREEYELVLALGLLTWQTPNGQRVHRHLVVADALLEFEARLGKFTVRQSLDGARVRPELDMLDIEEQPERAEAIAKEALTAASDNPWERPHVDGVLAQIVHSIDPLGEYRDTLSAEHVSATVKPIVEYAPALVLRKRSTKGLVDVLQRIRTLIESGETIPPQFSDLAEITAPLDSPKDVSDQGEIPPYTPQELLFPKPFNDEQREIAEKVRRSQGVLVQGPPGTGKSHTIANLVCHMLASGQRILVTAKTPRALQVLENLMPDEIRPLCVSLLGSGQEERRSLESSVRKILVHHDGWNEPRTRAQMGQLDQQILELRQEKAQVDAKLRAIREVETFHHSVADDTYQGTAAVIARTLREQSDIYGWFADRVPVDAARPVSELEAQDLLSLLRTLTPARQAELQRDWTADLPTSHEFSGLLETESRSLAQERELEEGTDLDAASRLANFEDEHIKSLREALLKLSHHRSSLEALPFAWVHEAVQDVLAGSSSVWVKLHHKTDLVVTSLELLAAIADTNQVVIPAIMRESDVLRDAMSLKQYLEAGGKFGWGPFRPKPIRDVQYLLTSVTLNAHRCRSLAQIQLLSDLLRVRVDMQDAWQYWAGRCEPAKGPFSLQLSTLASLDSTLDSVLGLRVTLQECTSALAACGDTLEPSWSSKASIQANVRACELALAIRASRRASADIEQIAAAVTPILSHGNPHPAMREMAAAIQSRDASAYLNAIEVLQRLRSDSALKERAGGVLTKLRLHAPQLCTDLETTFRDPRWDSRVAQIRQAWDWSRASTWLESFVSQHDAFSLAARSRQLDEEVGANIAKSAALRAWSFCFARLRDDHRRNMEAWQQAMRRLGKGTGKHAPYWRREAQQYLNGCREAVPAWVMPLHRVWDTVEAGAEMFDLVIVDEASQCGFEALPLFYIGKKILIVGDDKQISPDAVGLPRDAVHKLMRDYLKDFKFTSSFDVESSLFDHGRLRYGTRQVALREHFRCMPEIIRFSNDLCYSDTPLIPLRQYGPDRLPPLQHVYLPEGFREGANNLAINRVEAAAVARKIAVLCREPGYAGKTMGVVILQGDAQAGLIEEQLLKLIGAEEMSARRLVCGNPYSFQGDERDVIFLSMVAAPNQRIGPFTSRADERRFNVAASRARDQMWLFHSVNPDDLSADCLRRRLIEFFLTTEVRSIAGISKDEIERRAANDNRQIVKPPLPFESWFEVDVALVLARKNYLVIPQFEVAGKRIDLVVEGGQSRLAVECDGDTWHGADRYEEDSQRQRILERCGWVFFRVRESSFYADKEASLRGLWNLLEERGIVPIGCERRSAENAPQAVPPSPLGIDGVQDMGQDTTGGTSGEGDTSADGMTRIARNGGASGGKTDSLLPADLEQEIRDSLQPYVKAQPSSLLYPTDENTHYVEKGLCEIIATEGPILCARAYRIYNEAVGLHKIGKQIRHVFNRAISRAVRNGLLEQSNEIGVAKQMDAIVRKHGTREVVLRERGDRVLEEIPPSETAALMRLLVQKASLNPQHDDEQLFRLTLQIYGLKRLTSDARVHLERARAICVRPCEATRNVTD